MVGSKFGSEVDGEAGGDDEFVEVWVEHKCSISLG